MHVIPDVFHLTSLNPKRSILYLSISIAAWAHFPLWYSVLTFQVPILVVYLAENSSVGFGVICCFRILLFCSSSSLRRERVFAFVIVSVIAIFFTILGD